MLEKMDNVSSVEAVEPVMALNETTSVSEVAAGSEIIKNANEFSFEQAFVEFWLQGDIVNHTVMFALFCMFVISWTQILFKSWHVLRRLRINKILQSFWMQSTVDKAINLLSVKLGKFHIFTELARSAVSAAHYFDHQKNHGIGKELGRHEFIANNLRQSINQSTGRLESGMTLLASIGAVAPFVGLFGTIYGIYRTLVTTAAIDSANTLHAVSSPIGESLLMTAIGLFVAIPAILAYKSFTRSNHLEIIELEGFAHDLHSYLNINTKVSSKK